MAADPVPARRAISSAADIVRAAGLTTLDAIEELGFLLARRCCEHPLLEAYEPKLHDARMHAIVGELAAEHDHVDLYGAVYEQLIATLGEAGHLGQYFTPRHVVDLMVAMVDPRPGECVYDPAAGTGGFLLRAAAHAPGVGLVGRELNEVVRRLCVLNFLVHGEDPAGISGGDSLTADA